MNNFKHIEKELDFSEKWFENFKLINPSYYHIEGYITKLNDVIKNYKAKTEEVQNRLIFFKKRVKF